MNKFEPPVKSSTHFDKIEADKRSNTIRLMPVRELLGKKFYVPAYQRGYRWTSQQVTDLLEDIYSFANKKKSLKEFYCLQPIIVKPVYIDNNEYYEVVDGQQRLTTIKIILIYLINEYLSNTTLKQRYGKDLYILDYATRPKLANFLENINKNTSLNNNSQISSNIEFYHVSKAYQYIDSWFKQKIDKGLMLDKLYESIIKPLVYSIEDENDKGIVQVIWYELNKDEVKPIDVFIRTNLGKIALTNAELIKALFLQERNFESGDIAKLRQLEIAQEWDSIENQLQEEKFWWFLNKDKNSASSHIEFIFDLIKKAATSKNNLLDNEIGTDRYCTFRYYSYIFGNNPNYETIKTNWDEIKNYFNTFKEWYNHPVWYHYIGFLISCKDSSVVDIYNLLSNPAIKTKEDATKALTKKIKDEEFNTIKWKPIDNQFKIDLSYGKDTKMLKKFLLMYNLEYITSQHDQGNLIYKFPFKAFKETGNKENGSSWDIEHIIPTTDNQIKKHKEQVEWLNNAIEDFKEINEDLRNRIHIFISNENNVGFEDLYVEIINLSTDSDIHDDLKNSIGNLTLLDSSTNRGYGNSLFTTKRRKIIEKDKDGAFIPFCTKNIFLKYYSNTPKTTWTLKDIEDYSNDVEAKMSKFLIDKPKN